jgi:hypothetical protein
VRVPALIRFVLSCSCSPMKDTRPVFIYLLRDPVTSEVRYVGKSINPEKRFTVHVCRNSADSYRTRWLNKLKRDGLIPVLEVIERIEPGGDWQERERYWISFYLAAGCPLTNTTSGGDGAPDIPEEIEMLRRSKVSMARRGMQFTDKHRDALREAKHRQFANEEHRNNLSRLWAALSDEQVLEVWYLATYRVLSQAKIGEHYNIPQSSVSEIATGVRYKHVQRPTAPSQNGIPKRFDPRREKRK